MRAYVGTTGVLFALIVVAHIARLVAEGPQLLREPDFILTSIAAIGVAIWALVLWRRLNPDR